MGGLTTALGQPPASSQRLASQPHPRRRRGPIPYVPYIQYLLPGSIVMSVFMMVMIGRRHHLHRRQGARGLHEGYLVTPITKLELIAGFNLSGTIKGGARRGRSC